MGVVVSGGVSGGHLNPAITVAVASVGKFPWKKVPHYLAGQYLGAFLGSATVFLVYWDALVWYEHDRGSWRSTPETAGIFSTFPGTHLSLVGGILDQTVVTALLLTCVCAITDRKNMKVSVVRAVRGIEVWLAGIQAVRASLHRSDSPRHWNIFRLQLWLRHQPCPGPRPQTLHRSVSNTVRERCEDCV